MSVVPDRMDGYDAELAVLGAAMQREDSVERSGCAVEDFAAPRHRALWAAMQALRSRQEPIDSVTVTVELERTGRLDAAGGAEYVADMADAAGAWANVDHHGRMVREAAQARRLRRTLEAAVAAIDAGWMADGLSGVAEAVSGVTDTALRLMSGQQRRDSHTHHEAVVAAVARVEAAYNARHHGGTAAGLPWLFPAHRYDDCRRADLSSILPPMVPGDLISIAARTSGGKTVAGWQLAHDIARSTGRVTDYFTSEVDAGGMGLRSIARHAKVDGLRLRDGMLTDGDIFRLRQYVTRKADVPVMVWDSPTQTIEYIAAMLRVIEAQRPDEQRGGLVVLDYYQRIESSEATRRRLEKTGRLEHVAVACKTLAGQIRRPVLLLAQLRRDLPWGGESKEDVEGSKKLGDESDAMVIIRNAEADLPDGVEHPPEYAEAFIAKSRNGVTGRTLPMKFNGAGQQFEIWEGERWQYRASNGGRR